MKNTILNLYTFLIFVLSISIDASSKYLCTTKNTNILRSSPTTKSSRIKSLSKYTPLKKINAVSNWFQVKGIDYSGFIHKSLVTDHYKCIIIKNSKTPFCPSNKNNLNRNVVYRESFKIIKQEIGCNYVQDKWGKRFWLSSEHVWPREYGKLLLINFNNITSML